MAAPTNAYISKSIFNRNKENTADVKTLIALFTPDRATMLARFYVDGFFAVNTDEGDGVVGYCRTTSANLRMHNVNRYSNIRLHDGTSDCILFNDAGLNTLGKCISNPVDSTGTIGNIKIWGDFSSAYYVDTDAYGFKWRNASNTSNYSTVNFGALNQNTSTTKSYQLNTAMGLAAGQQLGFKAYITNAEGTYEGEEVFLTLQARQVSAKIGDYASTANQPVTVYVGVDELELGDKIYADALATQNVNTNKYYVIGDIWYQYGYDTLLNSYAVLSKGVVGSYNNGDPANQPSYNTFNWSSYDTYDRAWACAIAGGSGALSSYMKTTTGQHFSNTQLTLVIPDGYYTTYMGDYYDWTLFQNGYQVDTGSC